MDCEKFTPRPVGRPEQFIAWHDDVPYIVYHQAHGAGYFDRITFKRADEDFLATLANDQRELFADPEDIDAAGGVIEYLDLVLPSVT